MNYTENYHLPQWVKEDRIMMEDFNGAMANIENGLTGNAETAAGANQETAENAERRAFERICRLAYNHYCFVQTITPFPRQIGVFHQDTGKSGEGLTGMSKFEGYYQVCNGNSFDANRLFSLFQQQGPMGTTFEGGRTPVTITFTAPGNGSIDKLVLRSSYEYIKTSYAFTCDLTFQDLTTGKVVKTAVLPWTIPDYSSSHDFAIEENLCFHSNHQYRLTIMPRETRLVTSSQIVRTGMAVTCQVTGGEGCAAHTFQTPDENLGLLAVTAYRLNEGGGEPVLLFNGEEVPARWTRDVQDGTGKTIREKAFFRNGAVADGDTMTLRFSCQPGGEATLYSWGAVLL